MTGRAPETSSPDRAASRREFFKLLAASPLLGVAASGLPASWQRALAHEAERRTATGAAMPNCPECGSRMPSPLVQPRFTALQEPALPPQNALEDQLTGQVIESLDEAVNVWDLERAAHATNLPQHWDYLHMGVGDYETRRANREGFQRLMIRPRRLGGAPMGAISIRRPSYTAAVGPRPSSSVRSRASRPITRRARAAPARAARSRDILQLQSHQSSQSYADIAEARGEPHWFQSLHRARLEREQAGHRPRRERGLPRPGVDHRSARREQPRAATAHPGRRGLRVGALPELPSAPPRLRAPDAGGARGPGGPALPLHVGLRQAPQGRQRHEGDPEGHHDRRGGRGGHRARRRRHLRVEPRRPGRQQHVVVDRLAARGRRRGPGPRAGVHRQRRPPRHRHLQGPWPSAPTRSASARPYVWGPSAPSARTASPRSST